MLSSHVTHGLPRALARSPLTLAFLGCLWSQPSHTATRLQSCSALSLAHAFPGGYAYHPGDMQEAHCSCSRVDTSCAVTGYIVRRGALASGVQNSMCPAYYRNMQVAVRNACGYRKSRGGCTNHKLHRAHLYIHSVYILWNWYVALPDI